MPDLRTQRATAIKGRIRDLGDDFGRALPLLLDDLEAIDAANASRGRPYAKADEDAVQAEVAQPAVPARTPAPRRRPAAGAGGGKAKPAAARTATRKGGGSGATAGG